MFRNSLLIGWAGCVVGACGVPEATDLLANENDVASRADAISLGQSVPASNFPATAGLRYGDVTVGVTCTGTLVAPSWVLTAAHCLKGAAGVVIGGEDPAQWTIYLGDDDLNDGSDPPPFHGIEVHVHPNWDTDTLYLGRSDVALIKLDRPAAGVTPVPLRRTMVGAGTELTLVGFGRATATPTVEQQLSGILRMGHNQNIDCQDVPFDASRPEISNSAALCVNSLSAAGSCSRDSGGPAYLQGSSGLELAGVVSGSRNSNLGECGEYSIYAGVPQNLAFLDQYLKAEAPAPVAGNGNGNGSSGSGGSSRDRASGCSTGGVNGGLPTVMLLVLGVQLLGRRRRRRGSEA